MCVMHDSWRAASWRLEQTGKLGMAAARLVRLTLDVGACRATVVLFSCVSTAGGSIVWQRQVQQQACFSA